MGIKGEGLGMEERVLVLQGQGQERIGRQDWRVQGWNMQGTQYSVFLRFFLFLVSHSKEINPSAITVTEGRMRRGSTEGESRAQYEFRLSPAKEFRSLLSMGTTQGE